MLAAADVAVATGDVAGAVAAVGAVEPGAAGNLNLNGKEQQNEIDQENESLRLDRCLRSNGARHHSLGPRCLPAGKSLFEPNPPLALLIAGQASNNSLCTPQ